MTQHIPNEKESAMLDILTADLTKLNNDIKAAEAEEATAKVEELSAKRRKTVRQINDLLKGNNIS